MREDAIDEIKVEAGHRSISTTEKYIRTATTLRRGFGAVFPPLPPCLNSDHAFGPMAIERTAMYAEQLRKHQYRRWGLNPYTLAGTGF